MDAFIARKEGKEILVARKDNLNIEQQRGDIQAITRHDERKRELKRQGYEITHIPASSPEVKKIKKVKRVEIMKGGMFWRRRNEPNENRVG